MKPMFYLWYFGPLLAAIHWGLMFLALCCLGWASHLWLKKYKARFVVRLRTFSETVIEPPPRPHPLRREGDRA